MKFIKHIFKKYLFDFFSNFFLIKYDFKKIKQEKIDIGYGFAIYKSELVLSVNQIDVMIHDGPLKKKCTIFETPHYFFAKEILNEKQSHIWKKNYINYLKKYFFGINIKKKVKIFQSLFNSINEDYSNQKLDVFVLINKNPFILKNKYKAKLVDGTHRLAILAALGIEKVNCKIVEDIKLLK